MSTYSITLSLPGGSVVFTGYFNINNVNRVISFYDSTNPGINILSNGTRGGPDYLYQPGWACFSYNGCNITSFPYFYSSRGDYNLFSATRNPYNPSGILLNNNQYLTFAIAPLNLQCFKKNTKILTQKGYIAIQHLKRGDLVKTVNDFIPIHTIGFKEIFHFASHERIKDQLYKCSPEHFPVFEDLVITGCHSILVDEFKEGEREKTIKINGDAYVTEKKYRLPACVDDRTTVYETPGNYTIYHFALENDDIYNNYGVYANGLLVESCSIRYLMELSNMTIK